MEKIIRGFGMSNKKPLGYLGGDIMSFGSNLARQYEYDKFNELNLNVDVYSPVQNKSINDKNSVTEEENNHLAEKITEADIERLWNSDFVVMCPEQSAIGSMCETGCLFGWKWMAEKLIHIYCEVLAETHSKSPFQIFAPEFFMFSKFSKILVLRSSGNFSGSFSTITLTVFPLISYSILYIPSLKFI